MSKLSRRSDIRIVDTCQCAIVSYCEDEYIAASLPAIAIFSLDYNLIDLSIRVGACPIFSELEPSVQWGSYRSDHRVKQLPSSVIFIFALYQSPAEERTFGQSLSTSDLFRCDALDGG